MEHLASILLLALAVSLDSCGVGMTYGIRNVVYRLARLSSLPVVLH